MSSEELLHEVGIFDPSDAKQVLAVFEAEGIPFEIEADHSALEDPNRPLQLYLWMFPAGSKFAIFVPESSLSQAEAIVKKLYPV